MNRLTELGNAGLRFLPSARRRHRNAAYGAVEAIANPVNDAVTNVGDFFTGGGVSDSYRDLVYYFLDHPDEYRTLMENDPSLAGYSYDSKNGDQSSQFYQQLSQETGKSAAELGRFYNEYAASYADSWSVCARAWPGEAAPDARQKNTYGKIKIEKLKEKTGFAVRKELNKIQAERMRYSLRLLCKEKMEKIVESWEKKNYN